MAVAITTFGTADYFRDHGMEHRQASIDAGGYFVKGHGEGEPPPVFLGLALDQLGIARHETPERSDEIVKATWSNLAHPTTGESIGSAPRSYASAAENLAKLATAKGLTLPGGMRPADFAAARKAAPSGAGARVPNLTAVKAALEAQQAPEDAQLLVFKAQKAQRESVALYDVTLSPDKSVSVAHVAADLVGDDARADAFERSMVVGGEAMVDLIQSQLAFTRLGHHGAKVGGITSGRREQVTAVAAAGFMHHSSREGCPQDHLHTAVLNRVQCADGEWRAIDGQAIYHARGTLNVVGSRAQEADLRDHLGIRFEHGPDGSRRIAAVDRDVCSMFSKRAAVIDEKVRQWAERFEARYHRAPTTRERVRRADQIARNTRSKKAKGMAREEAVAQWDAKADERGLSLEGVYRAVMEDCRKVAAGEIEPEEVQSDAEVLTKALEVLNAKQSTWHRHHLIAEIDRQLPANIPAGMSAKEFFEGTVLRLAEAGLRREGVVCLEPEQIIDQLVPSDMADRQGLSLYLPRGAEIHADRATLDAEASLLSEALRHEAPSTERELAEQFAQDVGLVDDQAAALAGVLSSGRSLEVLIGPAGTGKSYTLSKLAEAWAELTDADDTVVALTVSQNAAEVLTGEGFPRATNLARWFRAQERLAAGRPFTRDRAFTLRRGQLIVVDEASMAAAGDIARVVELARSHGAKVLLTGDHRQLAAIEQGGALSLLAGDPLLVEDGAVHQLGTVRRFAAEWERDASLRLRDGDDSVVGVYDDHGRVIAGPRDDVLAQLVEDSVAHLVSGRRTCLAADTAEEAAALSLRIREALIAAGRVRGGDPLLEVSLHDGTSASPGDLIEARKNEPTLEDGDGRAVSNRDVFEVTSVNARGDVLARRVGSNSPDAAVVLPRDYVEAFVELAYASTDHAAQGRTVDAGAKLVTEDTSAEALYVGGTRGRLVNRFYVVIPEGDERSGVEVLKSVVANRMGLSSATEQKRDLDDGARSLARIGPVWAAAVGTARATQHRAAVLAGCTNALGTQEAAEALLEVVEADTAAPAFWLAVDARAAQGYDVADMVASTLRGREVGSAASAAQVLHYRLDKWQHMAWEPRQTEPERSTSLTYLERSPEPASLVGDLATPDHARYARHLAAAMDARVDELGHRVALDAPQWATKHLGPVPVAGSSAFEAWVGRAGIVAGYREQYLSPTDAVDVANPIGAQPSRYFMAQRYVDWQRANDALGSIRQEVDLRALDDAALSSRVERWDQAQEVAPPWVKPVLEKAHNDHRKLANRFDMQASTAKVRGRHFERLRGEVEASAARLGALQAQHDERSRWYAATAEVREQADEARAELARRHPGEDLAVVDLREDMAEDRAERYDAKVAREAQQRDQHIGIGRSI